jgi:hypothetical protein
VPRTRYDEPDEEDEEDDGPDWDGDDGDDYDPEDPETYPQGLYDDDGPATVACPHCGAEIIEDSERCPRCESYVSREDAPRGDNSAVWWILMILALFAAGMWVFGWG